MEKFIILPEGGSSSTILASIDAESPLPSATTLMLVSQTAGRGQRGNTWEAQPARNVTMSMLFRFPYIHPADQFIISQLVSIAIIRLLRDTLAPGCSPDRIKVKWPNDIYVDNSKIAGILIENTLDGTQVDRSIIGIGLNVNQTRFLSSAPNPVSIAQLLGHLYEKGPEHFGRLLARSIIDIFESYRLGHITPDEIRTLYRQSLWRARGLHSYTDTATGQTFLATITDIEPSGLLHLTDTDGHPRIYAFKQVIQNL